MIHRRGNGGGGGNRRRGKGANRGGRGGRGMRPPGGKGRHGRSGMAKGPGTRDLRPDNETLIEKLRFIKKHLFEMETAEEAPSPSRAMSRKPPAQHKNIPGITAIVDKEKCIGCGICADACLEGAISINGEAMIDPGKCSACGTCISVCPNEAISLSGLKKAANS